MGRIKRTREEIEHDIATQSKVCCVCSERKDFSKFYNFKNKSDNKSYRCKWCDDAARINYLNSNRAKAQRNARSATLRYKYGISLEDYESMLDKQGGCCAICKGQETRGANSFSVDHCHSTGKVRGLLCNNCNRGIGLLGDTSDGLMKAVEYLKRNEIDRTT